MKFKKDYYIMMYTVLLILALFFIVFSVSLFWIGYHNLDLGQNMRYLDAKHNLNLVDANSNGELLSGMETYSLGLSQIFKAFYVFGASSLNFILALYSLLSSVVDYYKEADNELF